MRVLVFGAQSHIGFALCERLLEEGVEVMAFFLDPPTEINRRLLEERLMLVGRNALFQASFSQERWQAEQIDIVIHCMDNGQDETLIERKRGCLKKSVEIATEYTRQFVLITSDTLHINDQRYLENHLKTYSIIKLPKLFGPFQPPEEPIHQFLISYLSNKQETLVIEEPILFIKDAVNAIIEMIGKFETGKVYSFLSELKNEEFEAFSVELKMNAMRIIDDESIRCSIKNQTTIEMGLIEQLSCIKAYKEIYQI